jgi:hypothetical protein
MLTVQAPYASGSECSTASNSVWRKVDLASGVLGACSGYCSGCGPVYLRFLVRISFDSRIYPIIWPWMITKDGVTAPASRKGLVVVPLLRRPWKFSQRGAAAAEMTKFCVFCDTICSTAGNGIKRRDRFAQSLVTLSIAPFLDDDEPCSRNPRAFESSSISCDLREQ